MDATTLTQRPSRPLRVGGIMLALGTGLVLFVNNQASAEDIINGATTSGPICMQQVFGTPVTNANKLNCTAGDIRLSKATKVFPESCNRGSTIPVLKATFEVNVTSNARYDAGFFFRTDGGETARGGTIAVPNGTGSCSLSGLYPDVDPAKQLDGDTCGDLNSGVQYVNFEIKDVKCEGFDDDNDPATPDVLRLPNCTSWHSNSSTKCQMTDGPPRTGVFPASEAMFFKPDTKSKCVCDDTFTVPVTVQEAKLTVLKSATATTPVQYPGAMVPYEVTVTNTGLEAMVISALTDTVSYKGIPYTYNLLQDPALLLPLVPRM